MVGALPDVETARQLIVALEEAGIDSSKISLLGAWPVEDEMAPPHRLMSTVIRAGTAGGVVGLALASLLVRRPRRPILALGGIIGAAVGSLSSAANRTGRSAAWRQTLVADASGTVAVGVHSDDVVEVVTGEKIMHEHGVLTLNRFDGLHRSLG